MLDEKELERRLTELKDRWRVPADPPFERMWQVIESAAFPAYRRPERWGIRRLLPLAAMLVLGFGIGKLTPALTRTEVTPLAEAGAAPNAATARPAEFTEPFVGVATDYLERVTALLVALADANRRGQPLDPNTLQAKDLLATTRLLLDSPTADPRLQGLLSDLELVLAQIVRLPRTAPAPDVYLIDQALDQREVLPRLRELLAENSTSQP